MANLSIQILAGIPDCIHANEGYAYPKPAVQLHEGVSAYSVSPSIATYTQGNAVKYSTLEESAYTSVTPAPIIKQAYYSAPVVTKTFTPQVTQLSYAAPLSKVATYTPTSNIVAIPAVKQIDYQYPKITSGYLPPAPITTKYVSSPAVGYVSNHANVAISSPGYTLNAPAYAAPIVTKYATSPALSTAHGGYDGYGAYGSYGSSLYGSTYSNGGYSSGGYYSAPTKVLTAPITKYVAGPTISPLPACESLFFLTKAEK